MLIIIYKYTSSQDITNIGVDATPTKRMIVVEALQEKISRLFEDDLVLEQQPLKSYVYFDDSAAGIMRILTQVAGSTIHREWSESDRSIKVRQDVYKDYAFRMFLVKSPNNDPLPTKLVIPETMHTLYRTTGQVDNANPGKLLLSLPTDRKIVNVLNAFD